MRAAGVERRGLFDAQTLTTKRMVGPSAGTVGDATILALKAISRVGEQREQSCGFPDALRQLVGQLRVTQGDLGSPSDDHGADARNRAFTLLTKTHAEVRRVVVFLCADEGDPGSVMPRLFGRPR